MTTTNGNRKILDVKRWEYMTPSPAATAAGAFISSSRHYRQQQLFVQAQTVAYLYNPNEDGWIQIPSPGLAAALAAGSCGTAGSFSTGSTPAVASLTATAGTTSTITTNQTLARDLRGYSIHILAGPNAGVTLTIVSNTIGANAVITVATQASAFSNATVYRLVTPVWYVANGGSTATASFRKYDFATNSWVTLANMPASFGTDARLMATPSWVDSDYVSFATGTATSATGTTLVNSAKTWTTNQWANAQVRIVSGTGAGQIRAITSNTSTTLTVPTWTTTPDATSVYSISGNDDYLYLMGNNAITLYRYSISANTWSTLSPGVARTGAPGAGMGGHWVWGVTAADWTNESAIQNGRYLLSFRGAGGALLDEYDIALNAWSAVSYAPAVETFTTGSKWIYAGDYIYGTKDATNRWFRFDIAASNMDGMTIMNVAQGTAVVGDTAFDVAYKDGATTILYLHMLMNTSTIHARMMVI